MMTRYITRTWSWAWCSPAELEACLDSVVTVAPAHARMSERDRTLTVYVAASGMRHAWADHAAAMCFESVADACGALPVTGWELID